MRRRYPPPCGGTPVVHRLADALDTRVPLMLRWGVPRMGRALWGEGIENRSISGVAMGTAVRNEAEPSGARARFDSEDFFGHQPTSTSALPDPQPLLENLTRCVIEILSGSRELEQIARWVSDDVYRHLLKRVVISARARQVKGQHVIRPTFTIGSTQTCQPRDGVVEAVVIVRGRARVRAVALRLEGLDKRWRATAI